MPQAETLPQSMVDIKTIVLKPRLDQGDIQLIGEKVKHVCLPNSDSNPNLTTYDSLPLRPILSPISLLEENTPSTTAKNMSLK